MIVSETYGVTCRKTYALHINKNVLIKDDRKNFKPIGTIFMAIFLPHGYPESVSKDYLQYQIWDSIQAFASSISGGLSTHAVLKGVGVGKESASPVAATITWLLKDGSYMIGKIGFAWLKGTKLDTDCKKWRLFADIMNDAAMFLDLMASYFENYFLPIICISGVLKALVGVAGGCTRAALTQHQARKNNMADVSAKDGSQETLVNLLALLCNLALIPLASEAQSLTWFLFLIMAFIHLLANYMAVKSVVMETFNEERFQIYADHYFKEGMNSGCFLTVDEVNKKENVFFLQLNSTVSIKLGTSFASIIQNKRSEEILKLLEIYKDCNYILAYSKEISKDVIYIVFNRKATSTNYMEALFQACYMIYLKKKLLQYGLTSATENQGSILEATTRDFTIKEFQNYMSSLKKMHFNSDLVTFDIDLWRVDW